jgi:hypothetical protein
MLVRDNTPSAGYISWSNVKISYKGKVYNIADGHTNLPFVYWKYSDPHYFYASNSYPTWLTDDDLLVFLNKNGIHLTVPNTTIIDGSLIVPESILTNALAANAVTAEKIAAGAITASKIAADAVGAQAIAAGAILAEHLAAGSVTANAIAADTIEAKHIKSLNGLNVNNQFIVDANGNVTFGGNLAGAKGDFDGTLTARGSFYVKRIPTMPSYPAEIRLEQPGAQSISDYAQVRADNGDLVLSPGMLTGAVVIAGSKGLKIYGKIQTAFSSSPDHEFIATMSFVNASLINGWGNYGNGYQTAQYMKDPLGYVHIRGSIKPGTNKAVAFILPAGYRPSSKLWYTVSAGTKQLANIEIRPTGEVWIDSESTTYVSLDDIIPFKAEK